MAFDVTSIGRSTATQGIVELLARNSVTTTNLSPADAWRNYLQGVTGGSGTDGKRDLETTWLQTQIAGLGGSSTGLRSHSLWTLYLNLKGYSGEFDDMFRKWISTGTL